MIEKLSELTFGQLTGYAAIIIALLSTVLEVSKIKVNPWSWLARKIGEAINGGVIKELDGIKKEIGDIKDRNEKQDAEREIDKVLNARRRILRFADEIRRGDRHSHEHFDAVLDDIGFYTKYCEDHPKFSNEKAVLSIKIIKDIYEKCARENDFL